MKLKFSLSLILVFSIFVFISCEKSNPNLLKLEGSIENIDNYGNYIFLRQNNGGELVDFASMQVENGKVSLEKEMTEPGLYIIAFDGIEMQFPIMLEPGSNIKFVIDGTTLDNIKVSGSKSQEEYNLYNSQVSVVYTELQNLGSDFQSALQNNDLVKQNNIRMKAKTLNDRILEINKNFIRQNPQSFVSISLLNNLKEIDDVKFSEIKNLYTQLSVEVKEGVLGKMVQGFIESYVSVEVGEVAPDFEAMNLDGGTTSLKSVMGKVTLIDFWAAWCKPCRMENPNIVNVYNKFKSKGLSVIGVSLDHSEDKWKQAVKDDRLNWAQISNLKYWQDPIAKRYKVNSIPRSFLLDENGVIVATNLRGRQLEEKVAELLR